MLFDLALRYCASCLVASTEECCWICGSPMEPNRPPIWIDSSSAYVNQREDRHGSGQVFSAA